MFLGNRAVAVPVTVLLLSRCRVIIATSNSKVELWTRRYTAAIHTHTGRHTAHLLSPPHPVVKLQRQVAVAS